MEIRNKIRFNLRTVFLMGFQPFWASSHTPQHPGRSQFETSDRIIAKGT